MLDYVRRPRRCTKRRLLGWRGEGRVSGLVAHYRMCLNPRTYEKYNFFDLKEVCRDPRNLEGLSVCLSLHVRGGCTSRVGRVGRREEEYEEDPPRPRPATPRLPLIPASDGFDSFDHLSVKSTRPDLSIMYAGRGIKLP